MMTLVWFSVHCLAIANWYWLLIQPFARQAVRWGPFILWRCQLYSLHSLVDWQFSDVSLTVIRYFPNEQTSHWLSVSYEPLWTSGAHCFTLTHTLRSLIIHQITPDTHKRTTMHGLRPLFWTPFLALFYLLILEFLSNFTLRLFSD